MPPIIPVTEVSVAECTQGYAFAQISPFDAYETAKPICMPDFLVLPTQKNRYKLKGTGSTGTTGIGYLTGSAYAPANNGAAVTFTNAASVGGLATAINAFTFVGNQAFPNSPYQLLDFSSGSVLYRTCGAAIRVRFKGTLLNSGGTVYAFRSPTNSDITGYAPSDIIPLDQCKAYPLEPNVWTTVHWKVATPADQQFTGTVPSNLQMVLIIVSATGSPQPFEFEAVQFNELVGSAVPGKTVSHSDPVGFGAVQELTTKTKDSFHGKSASKASIVNSIARVMKESTSYIKHIPTAIQYGKSGYNMITGLMGGGSQATEASNLIKGSGPIIEFLEDSPEILSIAAV